MSNLPSIAKYLQVEETRFRSPISESMLQKFGETANFLLDHFPVQPGTIHMFAGPEANTPAGYLVCDGRAISRTTYSNLFSAISTYWGVGDGLTTFNVPDFRGLFPRMVDTTTVGTAGRDPDTAFRSPVGTGTVAEPGSYQVDQFGEHYHDSTVGGGVGSGQYFAGSAPTNSTPTGNAGGNETRPKNLYTLFLIKT